MLAVETVNNLERIRAEQIKSIYRNASPGMMATLAAVIVLTVLLVYFNAADLTEAIVFVCVMSAQTLARLVLYRRYATSGPALDQWRKWAIWFTTGTVMGAASIGAGTLVVLARRCAAHDTGWNVHVVVCSSR